MRLLQALQNLKMLWSSHTLDFAGARFTLKALLVSCSPGGGGSSKLDRELWISVKCLDKSGVLHCCSSRIESHARGRNHLLKGFVNLGEERHMRCSGGHLTVVSTFRAESIFHLTRCRKRYRSSKLRRFSSVPRFISWVESARCNSQRIARDAFKNRTRLNWENTRE